MRRCQTPKWHVALGLALTVALGSVLGGEREPEVARLLGRVTGTGHLPRPVPVPPYPLVAPVVVHHVRTGQTEHLTTDANGKWALELPQPGLVAVFVGVRGFAPTLTYVDARPGANVVELAPSVRPFGDPEPGNIRVHARVVDARRASVARAYVGAQPANALGPPDSPVITDAKGEARTRTAAACDMVVVARRSGYRSAAVAVSCDAGWSAHQPRLVLRALRGAAAQDALTARSSSRTGSTAPVPPQAARARLVSKTGVPLAGIPCLVTEMWGEGLSRRVLSDPDGFVSARDSSVGLAIDTSEYQPTVAAPNRGAFPIDVVLRERDDVAPETVITGVVRDARGRPMADALVSVQPTSTLGLVTQVHTGADGTFTVPIRCEEVVVSVVAAAHRPWATVVACDEAADQVEIRLQAIRRVK